MMNKGLISKILFGIILLTLGFSIGTLSTKSSFASKTIEYKVIDSSQWDGSSIEPNLKTLGSEGWDYVGAIPTKGGNTLALFKR
jgi:hypothetical protein